MLEDKFKTKFGILVKRRWILSKTKDKVKNRCTIILGTTFEDTW